MSSLKELEFITNYAEIITDLLFSQFKNGRSPNLLKIITAFAKPLDEIERIAEEIYKELNLDDAIGEQLDGLGQIIVEPRNGRDDDDYRAALRFKVRLNRSAGQPEFLIDALKFFSGSSIVLLQEVFPAAMIAYVDGVDIIDKLLTQMNRLALGGVNFLDISASYGETPPFGYRWFGDAETTEGGTWAWEGTSGFITEGAGKFSWGIFE